jgi:two-component sensor histidine kinase
MGAPDDSPKPTAPVIVTDELLRRPPTSPDYLREKLAIQDLAHRMAERPSEVIPRLVALAMEICDGASAGVSVLDPDTNRFRWIGVQGELAAMKGVTVPRDNSPAGICMDIGAPVLLAYPERAFGWMQGGSPPIPELLLVPLQAKDAAPLGVLWVVGKRGGHFDRGHARSIGELAAFAAIALRMIQTEERLNDALKTQETLATEMSHRVKNLFALVESMMRLSARGAVNKEDLVAKFTARLHALADANALVHRGFDHLLWDGADFAEIITRILRPHDEGRSVVRGPALSVGEGATNSLALLFHELATNAAKYGALSVDQGTVEIEWDTDEKDIRLRWRESGGPVTAPPDKQGYGTRLVNVTMQQLGGKIDYDWRPEGLVARMHLPISSLNS